MVADDVSVSFPSRGVIRLRSRSLFGDPGNPVCRRFVERAFEAAEITGVTIRDRGGPHADLRFRGGADRLDQVVRQVAAALRRGSTGVATCVPSVSSVDGNGLVRYCRRVEANSGWGVRLDRPGRLTLRNRALVRRSSLGRAIGRELMGVVGIERCWVNSLTGTARVDYDPTLIARDEVLALLESTAGGVECFDRRDPIALHLPICTASVPIAAAAQFGVPALLPVAAGVVACAAIPTFHAAWSTLVRERRLSADALRSMVVVGCLGTMAVFPGAVLCWCLSVGRAVVGRAREQSTALLLESFGKRPRHAWLDRGGAEVSVPVERLRPSDVVVVNAGEFVPVDGPIVKGMALVDQHALTGALTPIERSVGDRVLAGTLVLGGRLFVAAEAAGSATVAARVGRILEVATSDGPGARCRGDRLADRTVVPTLGLGALALATIGPAGATAVLSSDLGAGMRLAAPLGMLGALGLCMHRGILVKDSQALARMSEVDTVLFDAAAISIGERPEFGDVVRGLRDRGIEAIALDPRGREAGTTRADAIAALRERGRTVCLVGDGLDDPIALHAADVSISVRGLASIASDAAQVVLLVDDLRKLCVLRDVARDLDRSVRRGWAMVLVPGVACMAGVFVMGFGIMASIATSNLAALAALVNTAPPLRAVAQLEAERRHRQELHRAAARQHWHGEPSRFTMSPDTRSFDAIPH